MSKKLYEARNGKAAILIIDEAAAFLCEMNIV